MRSSICCGTCGRARTARISSARFRTRAIRMRSSVIGPKIAQSKLAGAPVTETTASEAPAPAAPAGSPMGAVMQQLASLKEAVAKNPNDVDALVQLGDMYMQAAKFPQAAEYLQ